MKVALYQEGMYHCTPDIIKIYSSIAKAQCPEGFVVMGADPSIYAENETDERWFTIKEYEVLEA